MDSRPQPSALKLVKTVMDPNDHRKDNANKKQLFPSERHPHTAAFFKEQWACIKNPMVCDNIAYQMQYLEFMVLLYNDYQVYLTVESLLCKDIMATVGGIVEAALFDLIESRKSAMGMPMDGRTDFTILLGAAYHEYQLIDKDLWHFFHNLRKVRNNVHLKAADFQEHMAYTVDQANEALGKLEEMRRGMGTM